MNRAAPRAASVAARVVRWHRRAGRRGLPWQGVRDPYRVWLSEVMLQQTQVATALAYYERFVERYPDVAALAAAPLDDVLASWSGLGYYSRARHLHRCAQTIVGEYGGSFPRSSAELARLPGIGRSTAAAIAAFCFDERAAILDGNVKRVLARHLGFEADLANASAQRELWAHAESLLPAAAQMARYTQGLMDLGALVCLPRQPRCEACPLAATCVARRSGRTAELPLKIAPPATWRTLQHAVVAAPSWRGAARASARARRLGRPVEPARVQRPRQRVVSGRALAWQGAGAAGDSTMR